MAPPPAAADTGSDRYRLSAEQEQFRAIAARAADEFLAPLANQIELEGSQFPRTALAGLAQRGLLGLDIPTDYGGQGLDTLSVGIALEEIARGWFAATTYCAALGAAPILFAGNEQQRKRYLPGIASGELIPAFALTEADAGVDAAALRLRAERQASGDYRLRGSKVFITNAGVADVFVVFARTGTAEQRRDGISSFIVDRGTPGLSLGQRFDTLGHRANQIWEVNFDDSPVPATSLLGQENDGFRYVQEGFTRNRALYACRVIGVARAALAHTWRYVRQRQTFGVALASRDSIKLRLAHLATMIEAGRQLSYRAAAAQDQPELRAGERALLASQAKVFAAEMCMQVTTDCVQLMGGAGYTTAHPVERYFREAKLFGIGDGTSEILQLLVAREAEQSYTGAPPPARTTSGAAAQSTGRRG